MKKALAVALTVAFASPLAAQEAPLFYGTLHGADFSTQQLAQGRGGFEVNPLTRKPLASAGIHTVSFVGQLWIDKKLKGWKKWAFRGAVLSLHAYGTAKNLQAYKKAQGRH